MSEIELHRKLLGDAPRNAAFHAALKQAIQPGVSTVADLGAGTGFLSFLARQLGAAHCTLVEYSDTLDLAERLARKNKITGLTFIKAHSAQLKKPPQVDVVVSETLGNFALEENLLETAVDARRYLKKGGVLIPGKLRQFVAPVVAPRLQNELDVWPQVGYGLDLSEARTASLNNMYVKCVGNADLSNPSSAQLWDDLDFRAKTPPPSRRESTVKWDKPPTTVHGFALWWECELLPGIVLSTSPYEPPTHWEQIYLPLLEPLSLQPGDALQLTLTCDTRPEVGVRLQWKTEQKRGSKVLSAQAQDTFKGRW